MTLIDGLLEQAAKDPSLPGWLADARTEAAADFAKSELPSERDENFRYGRIDELDLAQYLGVSASAEATALDGRDLLSHIAQPACVVRTENGRVISIEPGAGLASGVSVQSAREVAETPQGFGDLVRGTDEAFGRLAQALSSDAVVIEAARGARLDAPIVVVHVASDAVSAPRTLVRIDETAELSVIELFLSGDGELLVLPVAELYVAAGAHLAYHAVQQLGAKTWQLGYQLSRLSSDASLRSFSAAFGGDYARLYTGSELVGQGAESRLLATYLARGEQTQDLRTFQEHVAAHTKSTLVFKGAVADRSRSVYTGLIHIAKGARRSDAAQTNRNIVLSEGAHADSVPNLDIEENDVRCSHASAVGPIDAEQRFYLESRGVPTEVAEHLILAGFFDDLLEDVPDPGCAAYLRSVFEARLSEVGS